MSKNLYVVLHDFTEIGDTALNYALQIAKYVHTDIKLLHVVSDESKEPHALNQLNEIIHGKTLPADVTLSPLVKVGNFIEDMGNFVKSEHAQLIIMGTHGALGLQKIFGSHAIKMIRHCEIPFLIVQKDATIREIKNIVVPIDLTKESLQIVNIAGDMATIFNGMVHILYENQNDERLSATMKTRIHIVKNNYEERNVKAEFVRLDAKGAYIKKIEAYAHEKDAELLAFSYHSESILPQFETFGQSLITNSLNLPCMVVNSKLASALYF